MPEQYVPFVPVVNRITSIKTPSGEELLGDPVNHPPHYTSHPSGVECIDITEHMNFCCGNAVKYIWRADLKGDGLEDLRKARWYVDREIARRIGVELSERGDD